MDYIKQTIHSVRSISFRSLLSQIISLALIVCSALLIWKVLIVYTQCSSPIVVVLSGSMEPAFYRGDLLFLSNRISEEDPLSVGDVVVFQIKGREIPIVHRIIRLHEDEQDSALHMLTKGDNNAVDDRGLYAHGQEWLNADHIVGRTRGMLPYVGMITIWMNTYPAAKFGLIGLLALLVLFSKDQ